MVKRLLTLSLLLALCAPLPIADAAATRNVPIQGLGLNVDHGINLTLPGPATSVFIANPEIADVQVLSPTSIMIFGKRTGETSFIATDSNGHALVQRTIRVTQDLSDLRAELEIAIPGNKIHASALPNGIVLTGEASDAATVADAYKMAQRYIPAGGDIINRIRVAGSNQIHIRVRFAEVSRKIDNTFGIDWDSAMTFGGFTLGVASGNPFTGGSLGPGITRPNNSSLTLPNDVLGLSHIGKRLNLNNIVDALAQDGLITILAEPNLTAMSGETASFLAGGEIPVPIPQTSSGGVPIITVEWKNYGISLEFTPTLLSGNRISLHVKPEVSQLTTTGQITTDDITIPGLLTRKAETTVEVGSGESFAIAGLLDNQQAQTINKFPLLGDLPIIGALFRSSEFQNDQSELVVIVTPYVVTPNGEQQLALPMDNMSPPSEMDRLARLRTTGSDPNSRTISGYPVAVRDPVPAPETAPQAAPVMPVAPATPEPTALPAPAPIPMQPHASAEPSNLPPLPNQPPVITSQSLGPATAGPTNLTPESHAPSGPGGFILE